MIRLLIVDDSRAVRHALVSFFEGEEDIRVVGEAADGAEAVERALELRPSVILMDLQMPEKNGVEATAEIMSSEAACPIVILSSLTREKPDCAFKALGAGAVDLLAKPDAKGSLEDTKATIIRAVRTMSKAKVLRRAGAPSAARAKPRGYEALLIGSSTGGPEILIKILERLPAPLPVPIIIAQHVLPGYEAGLALWLERTGHKVKLPEVGERPAAGVVYLGRGDKHLRLDASGRFEERDRVGAEATPAADDLFESALRHYRATSLIAAVLTGMGRDGARGIARLRDEGAHTLAQAPETCIVPSMPSEAIAGGGIKEALPPEELAARVLGLLHLKPPRG